MPVKTLTFLLVLFTIPLPANAEQPYNTPPSIITYCEQGFIGYDYSPAKDRKCHRLWGQWTRELLLEESDFISKL